MKVILLGLEFSINNLGCEALSYSFASELYKITQKQNKELELQTVVFADQKKVYIPDTDIPIHCIKIQYKSLDFWRRLKQIFRESDLIVDFTMGDSFSDIYGLKRFVLDAMVKTSAIRSKTPLVLGPQTYGPYHNSFVKKWAGWILKKAAMVYTRDEASKSVAEKMSGGSVILTTDVAFALPYQKKQLPLPGIKVGFNPSGLLWGGGYTHNNQFHLQMDYQKYCKDLIGELVGNSDYEIYLLPHVGTVEDENILGVENDLTACKYLKEQFPMVHILDDFLTPMEAKGYLSAMDIFIGARMHATIGSFSSGVATIPISYSRKFEGLYGSLNYAYVIHACDSETEAALADTLQYIDNYKELKKQVEQSLEVVKEKQRVFRDSLDTYIETLNT